MSYELAAVRFMEKHQWKLLHFAAYTDWPEETIKVLLKTIQIPNPSNIDIDELAEVINQCYKLCYELNFVHWTFFFKKWEYSKSNIYQNSKSHVTISRIGCYGMAERRAPRGSKISKQHQRRRQTQKNSSAHRGEQRQLSVRAMPTETG